MKQISHHQGETILQLHPRDVFHTQKINPGTTVICEQGILWLTRADDFHDYMLNPGESLVVNQQSNVVIEALSEARLSIVNHN